MEKLGNLEALSGADNCCLLRLCVDFTQMVPGNVSIPLLAVAARDAPRLAFVNYCNKQRAQYFVVWGLGTLTLPYLNSWCGRQDMGTHKLIDTY